MTALTDLDISFNNLSDLTPINGLTTLTSLNLGHTTISDITPLRRLTALTYLDLKNNEINDISSVSGLTQLVQLYLDGNQISDVSPIEGLTSLQLLTLKYNPIADTAPLQRLKAKNPNLSIDVEIEKKVSDLFVDSVRVNKNTVAPGEKFRLDAIVKNQGEADSAATPLRYYRSIDDTISTTDTEVRATILPIVAVNATDELSIELTAPDTPGVYYYGVCVDAVEGERDTTNNCSTSVAITVENSVPRAVGTIPPQTLSENDPPTVVDVAAYFTNPNNTTLIYIAVSDNTAVVLTQMNGSELTLTPVGAGNTTVSVAVSDGALTATQVLSISVMAIETQAPDLHVASVRINKTTVPPGEKSRLTAEGKDRGEVGLSDTTDRSALSTITPGEQFRLNVSIQNRGEVDAIATTLRYYLSVDDTISPEDMEVHTATLPIIAADAMREPSVQLTAPDAPGVYYYGVCVDAVEGESDTNNNCSTAVAVTVENTGRVDFVVESVRASKTTVKPGENFQISAVIRNQGEIAATATPIRYYLSTDEDITTADTEMHTATLPRVAADATRQQARQFTAPDTPGTYYYGVCVDAVEGESDTANNCSDAVAVTVGGADLMIDGTPQVSKTTLSPGETFQINTRVWNQGSATSDATTLRYYLSTDETISAEDTEVDSDNVATLSGKGAHASRRRAELSKTLTAPDTPGDYYYGVCVDVVAGDANIVNNCSQAIAITVEAPPEPVVSPVPGEPGNVESVEIQGPDLIISAVRVDASTIKIGGGVRFHLTLTNQGTSKAPATIIRYYRSSDATISAEDTELRAVPVGELGAGKSYTTWALLPSAFSVGTYYYGACLDGVASEFDTTNNCSDALEIIMVLQSDPIDGLESRGRIPPQTLKVEDSPEALSASRYFAGKVETWEASSSKPSVVTVSMAADSDVVTLTPVSRGHSVVTVTASHGDTTAQQTFDVYVGIDPTLVLRWAIPISPQSLAVGGSPLVLDVSSHVENEAERWRAVSSHPGIVVASLSGSEVTLTPVSEGNAEVTIYASGGTSEVQHTFRVFVGAAGAPDLQWVIPVPPQTLVVGRSPVVLDVSGHVAGEVETWQASSSNETAVTASLSGSVVTLTPVGEGSSNVTLSARRGDLEVSNTFTVSVGAADGLEWGVPIPSQTLEEGGSPIVLDVSGYVVGEVETWEASSSNEAFVTVSMSGSVVTLTPVSAGSSDVTISARRGDLEVRHTFTVSVAPDSSPLVSISDAKVRTAVRDALGLEEGDILTQQKMQRLTNLYVNNSGNGTPIGLEGLEHATNLRVLSLRVGIGINDITPLTGLTALTDLTIQSNVGGPSTEPFKINDLTPLQNLTALTSLNLHSQEQISNITPLGRFTALTYLRLSGNKISDLTPLQNLTALEQLHVSSNEISDLTPLANLTKLRRLSLASNQISAITPLSSLTQLIWLWAENNQVSDLTPLANLTSLRTLRFEVNEINDLTPLANLTALNDLRLSNTTQTGGTSKNQITDVTPLEGMTALTRLDLQGNPIEDLAPLRRLKENNPSVSIDIDINADLNNAPTLPSIPMLPNETALLSNYPNPFNPETWIPYQLAKSANVTLTIYDVRGVVVRQLALGHRPPGFYYSRGRAAHWDGRNQLGEKVASGLYFYTFTAGDFTATQKLLIRK